jgi:hypothetical protein
VRGKTAAPGNTGFPQESEMSDLLYVGITIVVFAVLFLLVKGVEHLER